MSVFRCVKFVQKIELSKAKFDISEKIKIVVRVLLKALLFNLIGLLFRPPLVFSQD